VIETIITICALSILAPYYDCDKEWEIVILGEEYDLIPHVEALGTASYNRVGTDRIMLVNDYKDRLGKHDYMLKGGGVLWHEILHMYCECNWHGWLDKREDMKRSTRANSFGMKVPEEIKPYLKEGWWQG